MATEALVSARVTMPAGRMNPRHRLLARLVGEHLRSSARWHLSARIAKLYELRIMADYMPQVVVERSEARIALQLMNLAFRDLEAR
jgi:hypothetical protein